MIFKWTLNYKEVNTLQMFIPVPSQVPRERTLFLLRKFMKLITLKVVCRFPQFPLSLAWSKQASFCLCLWRKSTLLLLPILSRDFVRYKIWKWVTIKRSAHFNFVWKIYIFVELLEKQSVFWELFLQSGQKKTHSQKL